MIWFGKISFVIVWFGFIWYGSAFMLKYVYSIIWQNSGVIIWRKAGAIICQNAGNIIITYCVV